MEKRIVMNTDSLQKEFPEVYQDFFAKHDLVLSGNFNLVWTPVGVGEHNILNYIKQKLPTKCFIGINITDNPEILINTIHYFDIVKNQFEQYSFSKINNQIVVIQSYIKDFLMNSGFRGGLQINILSENSRGHGVGFSGTFSAVLVTALYFIIGKIDKSILNDSSFINSNLFKEIHLLSRKLDYISRYGKTIGENTFFTLMNSSNPVFFMNDKTKVDTVDQLSNNNICFFDVKNILANNFDNTEIPIDYAIVFSGKESKTIQVEHYRDLDILKGNKIKDYISEKFKFVGHNLSFYGINNILVGTMYDWYNNILLTLSSQWLYYFDKIINEGYDTKNIEYFINLFNLYRYAISLVEEQNPFADDFLQYFHSLSENQEVVGIMPIYSGKFGGGYLFVSKQYSARDNLDQTISNLRKKYNNCCLEYVSWIDGTSKDSVKIEQYISEGVFSRFVSKDSVYYRDNQGKSFISNYTDIINMNIDNCILLDGINKKIFINGRKLTSKDILSQSTTIEMFAKFFENNFGDISNKTLAVSSYSKNKNEMLGKIVIPFNDLIKNEYGKNLNICCSGSLGDYIIKIGDIDLKICYIVKL